MQRPRRPSLYLAALLSNHNQGIPRLTASSSALLTRSRRNMDTSEAPCSVRFFAYGSASASSCYPSGASACQCSSSSLLVAHDALILMASTFRRVGFLSSLSVLQKIAHQINFNHPGCALGILCYSYVSDPKHKGEYNVYHYSSATV